MIHRIAEDVVERRLELIGRRGIGLALVQVVLAIIIVGFIGSFLTMAATQMMAKLPADWLGRFDCWWRLIAALLILGGPALLIGGMFLRLVLATSDGWRRLTWDERAGELIAVRQGGLFGFSQQQTIPLAAINRIDLHASPGGRNLALKLIVRFAKDLQRKHLEFEVNVQHVDRREEAMDLLFRIGRMCGLAYYAIEGSDLRNLKLRLLREPMNSDRFQPIPDSSSAVRYEDDVVSQGVQAPAMRVGKFRPGAFAANVSGTRLVEWQPGQRVHFRDLPPDFSDYVPPAGFASLVAGVISYEATPLAAAWLPGWATMAVAIALAAICACCVVYVSRREREVILDWPAGRVSWRIGSRVRHALLSAIESFLLRGLKQSMKKKGSPGYTNYWCRLEMNVEGRTVYILQSNLFRDLADAPAERLGPLAAALGESLNVPWQWREYGA